MKIKNLKLKIVFFLLLITCYVLRTTPSFAQSLPLTAYPAIQDKEVRLGEKTRLQVQFKNGSDTVVSGFIKVADYMIGDKQGTPILIEGVQQKPKYSASSWIKISQEAVSIPPHDFITIDLFVTVPDEIKTCGNYALVYFESTFDPLKPESQGTESASAVTTKLGTLINFITESKTCKEGLMITKFSMPSFIEYGPIDVTIDMLNTGDSHVIPKGVVILSNMLRQPEDQKTLIEQRIFPESAKEYNVSFGRRLMFGRYKIDLTAVYGKHNQRIEKSTYVWVIPWKIITVIILTIVIIILILSNMIDTVGKKQRELEKKLEREEEELTRLREEMKRK